MLPKCGRQFRLAEMANVLAICLSKMSWMKPSKHDMIVQRECRRTSASTVLPEGTLKKLIGIEEAMCVKSNKADRHPAHPLGEVLPFL